MPHTASSSVVHHGFMFVVLGLIAATGSAGELNDKLAAVTGQPQFKHAHWGLLIVDLRSGETIYEENADKLFAPASTTKLYSVAAAMEALGADYRFETAVYATAPIGTAGDVQGNLIVVASGDLTFGGRTDSYGRIAFRNVDHTYASLTASAELTEQDPLAGLKDLARQVAASGVKRLVGDVLIDDRLFEPAVGTGSGPGRLTPIMVNDNVVDVLITPGEVGSLAQVKCRPESPGMPIDAQVETAPKGGEPRVHIGPLNGMLVVRGSIPTEHKPLVLVHEVTDAAAFARLLFIDALREAGVRVDASIASGNNRLSLPARDTFQSLRIVATLSSPRFAENARLILKVSHNLHASTLPLLVAARNGRRTLSDGLRLQHDFLSRIGVDVDTISFGGGAGGDRADYVTPRATVQLLRHMKSRPDFEDFFDALPQLGIDGTLHEAVSADSPARGKIQAKTGTIYFANVMNARPILTSKALAGYATTKLNRRLAFAIFVNHVHLKTPKETTEIGRTLGRLCEVIYDAL